MTTGRFETDLSTIQGQVDSVEADAYVKRFCDGCGHPARFHDERGFCAICGRLWSKGLRGGCMR